MSKSRDEVMDKVRKLLAMANDGRGNMHEAEAAMRQATALMRKYNIESADEVLADLKGGKDMVSELDSIWAYKSKNKPTKCPTWVNIIAWGVAHLNGCNMGVRWTNENGVMMSFSGYKADVEFCRYLYRYLIETVYRLSAEAATSRGDRESFRYGASCTLQARMKKMVEDQKAADEAAKAQQEYTGTMALVLVDAKRLAVVAHFGEQNTKDINSREYDAMQAAGQAAGRQLNIPTARPLGETRATFEKLA